jgi:hypothetical protein
MGKSDEVVENLGKVPDLLYKCKSENYSNLNDTLDRFK